MAKSGPFVKRGWLYTVKSEQSIAPDKIGVCQKYLSNAIDVCQRYVAYFRQENE